MNIVNLPLELISQIIQHLKEDAASLQSCALSSTSFVVHAQRLLFSHIRLVDIPLFPSSGDRSLNDLRKLLKYSPHIGKYVKSLEVFIDSQVLRNRPSLLGDLLLHLRNLEALRFDCKLNAFAKSNMDVPSLQFALIQKASSLPSLTSLDVKIVLPALSAIGLCRSLQSLTLRDNVPCVGSVPDKIPPTKNIPLQSLKILIENSWGAQSVRSTLLWLLDDTNPIKLSSLRQLEIDGCNSSTEHTDVWMALTQCADSLEEFGFYPAAEFSHHGDAINLGILTRLRRLTFKLKSRSDAVGEWNHFPHLIDKLKTISSQSNIIETLQIAVSYLSLPSRRDASQWEEPISLVQQRLGCLKKFEVRLSRYSGESSEMHEFMEELRIYLRPFDRTGILDLKLGYL